MYLIEHKTKGPAVKGSFYFLQRQGPANTLRYLIRDVRKVRVIQVFKTFDM